ncbi:MAG: phytase, partial [Flavicella sp.]
MKKIILYVTSVFSVLISCDSKSKLPVIHPDVITEKTKNDTDDPAIWVHPDDPEKSIVFGTDKESNGAIYAFDLDGKIIEEKTIYNVKRPNNVDVTYGFSLNDSTTIDVLAFTEREKQQIRLYSVPDMKPLDMGGCKVFEDATEPEYNLPMGIAFYSSPITKKLYVIVGRKKGPENGYLYQYELIPTPTGIQTKLVRKFGAFSGKKEIEAIAVDNELGFIYYSDEQHCIRKYHAEPNASSEEINCFGGDLFESDIEGIAIVKNHKNSGYLIVSNQQKGEFNIFDRQSNAFVNAVNLSTHETDGCEATTVSLGSKF